MGFSRFRSSFFIAALLLLSYASWITLNSELSSISSFLLDRLKEYSTNDKPVLRPLVDSSSLAEDNNVAVSDDNAECDDSMTGLFAQTYVVSLPHRLDRREDMGRLRQALGLNWTFVDATSSTDSVVPIILDQVRFRQQSVQNTSYLLTTFDWLDDLLDGDISLEYFGSDLWTRGSSVASNDALITPGDPSVSALPTISSSSPIPVPTLILNTSDDRTLTCASRNMVFGPPYVPSLPTYMRLLPAKIACWYSHLQVIRTIASKPSSRTRCADAVLVLEDDIDMEKDIKPRLGGLWAALPPQWDIVFLGHCWSNESHFPSILTTNLTSLVVQTSLHPSFAPKCTHAYALSRTGAVKLLNHLRYPPFAYSRALDQAISWLVLSGRLNSYSVVPSVVVQRKVARSDVDAGREGLGSDWKDSLVDGVLGG